MKILLNFKNSSKKVEKFDHTSGKDCGFYIQSNDKLLIKYAISKGQKIIFNMKTFRVINFTFISSENTIKFTMSVSL